MRTKFVAKIITLAGTATACLLLGATIADAHHAFAAEFDANKPVNLRGVVTRIEWINPHAWIHITNKNPDGTTTAWMVEGGTPNTLQRNGITRESIKVGTLIVVSGYRAKDGRMRANGRDITLPDGRTLFMGSSGTGAPRDGKDPNERAPVKKGNE